MTDIVAVGGRDVGDTAPTFVIAEIGINHNGDLDIARRLIDVACDTGCDAVKFQKRTPEICVPDDQKDMLRETPWGRVSYLDYRRRIEFGAEEYGEIDEYCRTKRILWLASCWDIPSLEFIEGFSPACHKIASATLTDDALVEAVAATGRPTILSTGMSDLVQIRHAVSLLGQQRLLIAHCTSAYPCDPADINLRVMKSLRDEFGCPVGYSGHETGLQTTLAAVSMGACFVERHITLDRAMWGSDQASSVEPQGLQRLVRDIRVIEAAMGDGIKRVYDSEQPLIRRLRRTT